MRGLTGWVTTEFSLDSTGKPRDIRIIYEVPKNTFYKSAIRAIRKWRFKPYVNSADKKAWLHKEVDPNFWTIL